MQIIDLAMNTVTQDLSGKRLDQVLAMLFADYSRERIKKSINSGFCKINGKTITKPRYKTTEGEVINLSIVPEIEMSVAPENIALDIIYEDDYILVLNKPAGLVVHPAPGNYNGTLVNALVNYLPELQVLPRAGVVHRLDKDTTGVMVVAKTLIAHTKLVQQLQDRIMGRVYAAAVIGNFTAGGKIEAPIGRHHKDRLKMAVTSSGKFAVTHYRILQQFPKHSYLECSLETGRTHQIRVHMAHIRHPLIGDKTYGASFANCWLGFKRQALHAKELTLHHPQTNSLQKFNAPLPEDFTNLLQQLANN